MSRVERARVAGLDVIAQLSAYERLVRIVQEGVIRATNMPWTHRPCVCFTECVWGSLLDHAQRYSPYGVGFHKSVLFEAGGGPAIYMRQDLFRAGRDHGGWPDEVWPYITPFVPEYASEEHRQTHWAGRATACDYTHEREWRVPHDFAFQVSDIEFLTVASYEDEARMPRELKDAIGRENILLMDNYSRVNTLWPWHHY
jgi:hypothetical protein